MARDLFKKLNNPTSTVSRNPFDLSQRVIYSARAGMCIPTLCMETVKGDTFKIDTTVFNRTVKLLAPAFFRCKQYNHFYFVPYNTLWHNWDSFFTRSTEQYSAASKGNAYVPSFDISSFIKKLNTNELNNIEDMLGYQAKLGCDRLMQMLGYLDSQVAAMPDDTPVYANLFRIAAYNKIWYWYFRDKRHSIAANLFTPNQFVQYYNLDDIDCSSFQTSHVTDVGRLVAMFAPKYRTWDSDVFTNNYENTQFGDVSILSSNITTITLPNFQGNASQRLGISVTPTGSSQVIVRNSDNTAPSGGTSFQLPNLFNILSLRRAESVQHWRELMLRAGDSSKKRYEAMFGSSPKRDDDVPYYLGGFDVNLNIDDVTSTSFTTSDGTTIQNNGLGELAGKGIMVKDGHHIQFNAPDYGIIMCITTFLPLSEYDGRYMHKANTLLEPTDFYVPQYDRLGFEPIVASEQFTNNLINRNIILGYTVRNHYLKSAVDRIYNNFRSGKSWSYWTNPRRDLWNPNPNLPQHYRVYYVDPANLNPLFGAKVDDSPGIPDEVYDQDQFQCMSYFNINAIRPMSELGLPPM